MPVSLPGLLCHLNLHLHSPYHPTLTLSPTGYHVLNFGMFELAAGYRDRGMAAYSELQQKEFAREKDGYTCE